jgi:hypothetical protein
MTLWQPGQRPKYPLHPARGPGPQVQQEINAARDAFDKFWAQEWLPTQRDRWELEDELKRRASRSLNQKRG